MLIRGCIPTAGLDDGIVTVRDGVIEDVVPAATADGGTDEVILPGLIDIHCHGGGGHAFTTTDPDQARAAAAHHAARGTTRVMASLVTAAPEVLLAQVAALAPLVASGELLGIHLEGPFLSAARCGAQSPEFIRDPDPALAARLLEAGGGAVRVVTLAPERPGAGEVADLLRSAGVRVALGHTDASYEVMASGLARLSGDAPDRGTPDPIGHSPRVALARGDDPPASGLVTHLANGMPPLHHRHAGPVAAALVAAAGGEANVELIADGVHVDAGFTRLVFAAAAPGRVVLITDAMAAAGMPDGTYDLGPLRVRVSGGVARLAGDGSPGSAAGALAGGTSSLLQVVATARAAGVPLADAVAAASVSPARVLDLPPRAGTLTAGAPADLVVADRWLHPRRVLRDGRWIG